VGIFLCHACSGSDNPWGDALAELYSDVVGQKVSVPVALEMAAKPTMPPEEIIHIHEVKKSQEQTEQVPVPSIILQEPKELLKPEEIQGQTSPHKKAKYQAEDDDLVPDVPMAMDVDPTEPAAEEEKMAEHPLPPPQEMYLQQVFEQSAFVAGLKEQSSMLRDSGGTKRKAGSPLSVAHPAQARHIGIRKTQTQGSSSLPPPPLKKAASLDPSKLTRKPSQLVTTLIQSVQDKPEVESAQMTVLRQLARKLTTRTLQRKLSPKEIEVRTQLQSEGIGSLPASPRSTISDSSGPLPSPRSTKSGKLGTISLPSSSGVDRPPGSLTSSDGAPSLGGTATTTRGLPQVNLTDSYSGSEDGGPLLDPKMIEDLFSPTYVHPKKRQISYGGLSRGPSRTPSLSEAPGGSPFSTVQRQAEEPVDPDVIVDIYDRLGVTEDELQPDQLDDQKKKLLQRKMIHIMMADIIPAEGYDENPDFKPDFEALFYVFKHPDQFGDLFDFTIDKYLRFVFQAYMRSSYENVGRKLPNPLHGRIPSDVFRAPTDALTASIVTIDEAQ
jgi:hypothetical protein